MISDLWGVTAGFRQSNAWLAVLTGNLLPPTFYAGDAWGSFNSLARLGTGLLAAFGLIFWLFHLGVELSLEQLTDGGRSLPLPNLGAGQSGRHLRSAWHVGVD